MNEVLIRRADDSETDALDAASIRLLLDHLLPDRFLCTATFNARIQRHTHFSIASKFTPNSNSRSSSPRSCHLFHIQPWPQCHSSTCSRTLDLPVQCRFANPPHCMQSPALGSPSLSPVHASPRITRVRCAEYTPMVVTRVREPFIHTL